MEPIRSHYQTLYVDSVAMERRGADFVFTLQVPDVNCVWTDEYVRTVESVVEHGPTGRMSAKDLEALARDLGREPESLAWYRDRRLLERIVADDASLVAELEPMAGGPTLVTTEQKSEPILTVALGVAAWKVARALVDRGEPLLPPPGTIWTAVEYAIAALDETDGAAAVLERLIARGAIRPTRDDVLRHARHVRVLHALLDTGAKPNKAGPTSEVLGPFLADATPLSVAIVHRDNRGFDRFDIAAALLERGASIDARDPIGRTPLIVAAIWGYEEPVRWLLERGANLRCAPDTKGRTPRSLAEARPDDESSKYLLAELAKR